MPNRLVGTTVWAVVFAGGWCAVGIARSHPTGSTVALALVAGLTARLGLGLWRHGRLAQAFRVASRSGVHASIPLRWLRASGVAAVAGSFRPRIYCDPGLASTLTRSQLTAVVLHERHHQLRHDPMRLMLLSAVEPVIRWVPGGRDWLSWQRARIEIDADRYALERGADRSTLAAAILHVAQGEGPAANAAGFTSAVDRRLRVLLDPTAADGTITIRAGRKVRVTVTTFALVTCGSAMLHHHLVLADVGTACLTLIC